MFIRSSFKQQRIVVYVDGNLCYINVLNNNNNNKRFRCLSTPAFDFNFFELLTLGIFTTEGEKIKRFKKIKNKIIIINNEQ